MKIGELAGDDQPADSSKTFIFYNEDHTFGNVLRSVIAHYPEVDYCGYTVPHPAEKKMHLRIQTNGARAIDMLQRGLEDIEKLCDHTIEVFDRAHSNFSGTTPVIKQENMEY